jgi:CBS domain-containing protein
MKITEIPEFKDKKELLILKSTETVEAAAKQMTKYNYGATVVVDNNKLSGIFTERDLLVKVVAEGKDYKSAVIADFMTKNVKTANLDDDVYDSMRRMTQGRFRHLPIVDDKGVVIGMVSQGDFVAITWSQLFQQFKSHTKMSFSSNTQIWMFIILILTYIALIYVLVIKL